MIDKDLIIDKEDYIKNSFINTLKTILNETNNNNIDSSILEIKKEIEEFNILSEKSINIEENILSQKSLSLLEESLKNTKKYNLENTAFKNMNNFFTDSLITIGAESSVGKTSFATQLAIDILENNDDTILAFYSLDDSKTFLLKKIVLYILSKHNIKNDDDIIEIIEKEKDNILKIINSKKIAIFESLHIYNIYSELLTLKEKAKKNLKIKNPKLIVVIDYLQIIDHESSNLREGLNKICKELKDIQKKLNCLMIILSQFNRLPITKDLKESPVNTLNRYRETSEIENVSDLCINLEKVKHKNYNTKLYIVKNKRGEKDIVFTSKRIHYTFTTFINATKKDKSLDFNEKAYYNSIENNNNNFNENSQNNEDNQSKLEDIIF